MQLILSYIYIPWIVRGQAPYRYRIVNIDINTTTQDVYTYEYKHGYEKNK